MIEAGPSAAQKPRADLLIRGAAEVLTCVPTEGNPVGRRQDTVVAIAGKHILAVGTEAELTTQIEVSQARILDVSGKIVAPGFIDCHTHLVFGGSRVAEYAARLKYSPAEFSALGMQVGIPASVAMTRRESAAELTESGLRRLKRMLRHGTTTVESKSGYGLSTAAEIKMLEVNRSLQEGSDVDVVSTFLGAHEFPPEMGPGEYVQLILDEMIPAVQASGLADFIDVYCDAGYYDLGQTRRILEAGAAAGLRLKIHVDAYANIGGSDLAAELSVVSADHLNYTTASQARRLAAAGVIGVVMPALDFAVAHTQPFDARGLMAAGLDLALATDFCPACWIESMQLVMVLACRLYGFTAEEALLAATLHAARALNLEHDRGSIEAGKLADLQIWNVPSFEDVIYRMGNNAVESVVRRGKVLEF
jgi:imidazolonepropionase